VRVWQKIYILGGGQAIFGEFIHTKAKSNMKKA
jgi:hypothetical protein